MEISEVYKALFLHTSFLILHFFVFLHKLLQYFMI